jgi:nicotine oxidoreductase
MTNNNSKKLPRNKEVTNELKQASGLISDKVKNKINVINNIQKTVQNAISKKTEIPIFNNLMPIISSREVLLTAYSNIKSNQGSMTPGTTEETADNMSLSRITDIQERLKNGNFKFPNVRRKWLPKPIKNIDWKKNENLIKYGRPLGMPDFDSKIVQEAIRMTLNAIYDPIFESYNVSFGFRPNKGCHNAIINLPSTTQGMFMAIEGDIKGAFNNMDHNKLRTFLQKRISDKKFIELIIDACTAGVYDELQKTTHCSLLGVPQGGIVSPLLWNIYMHEFDKYIKNDLQETINTINKRQRRSNSNSENNIYKKLIYKQGRYKKIYQSLTKSRQLKIRQLNPNDRATALSALNTAKQVKKIILKTPSKNPTKLPIRYTYVRYADDWILFTNAKKTTVQYIKNKIASFLKYHLSLTLSLDKTKITNLKEEKAKFLGFSIKYPRNSKIAITKTGALKRVTGQKISIGIDMERILPRLEWRKFLKKGKPREQPSWSVLSDYEIIQKYNSIIRGLVLYYAPIITTRSTINYLVYIMEYSCYKTLCQKHRATIRKLIKKHGHPIKTILKNDMHTKEVELLTTKHYWQNLKATCENVKIALLSPSQYNTKIESDFLNNAKTFWRTQYKLTGRCVVCGTKEGIQMHHIRHINGYHEKTKMAFQKIMGLLNRKQVPLCKEHHLQVHKGTYDDLSLIDLYDTRIATVENYITLK